MEKAPGDQRELDLAPPSAFVIVLANERGACGGCKIGFRLKLMRISAAIARVDAQDPRVKVCH